MTVALQFFRVAAACTSTMMLLSPIPSIRKTLRDKSTGVGSIVPLVSMLTNSHNALLYGYLCELYFPVFSTFVLGDLLSLVYIAIFYRYTHERAKAHRVFLAFGIPLGLVTLYSILGGLGFTNQSRYDVGQVEGYIGIVATVALYSSPFEKVTLVLKHRSAVFLNVHMICAGTVNNVMWIAYSYLTREWPIFAPNVFGCTMGCIQICLYVLFHPSTHPYDGPIPGLEPVPTTETADLELGDHARNDDKPKTHFVALASPGHLVPPNAHQ